MLNSDEISRQLEEKMVKSMPPIVLLDSHISIDPQDVIELTSCFVNDVWAGHISGLIKTGWVLIRVQTEFGVNGHQTMAYFVKLKQQKLSLEARLEEEKAKYSAVCELVRTSF